MPKIDYHPHELPAVDEIHVLVVSALPSAALSLPILATGFDGFAIHSETKVVDEEAVNLVATAWRQLPFEEQSRCHVPHYGIRFLQRGALLLEGSICWRCNNIFIRLPEGRTFYGFDAESEPATRLLKLLRYLSGEYLQSNPWTLLSLKDYL